MDNDGDMDILTAGASGSAFVWYPNQRTRVPLASLVTRVMTVPILTPAGILLNMYLVGAGLCNICLTLMGVIN